MGSCDKWGFPLFFIPQWQSLCYSPNGKCLPLGLCKGTVKESSEQARNGLVYDRQYTGCLVSMDSGTHHGLDIQTGSCNADNSRLTMPWAPHEQLISKQEFFILVRQHLYVENGFHSTLSHDWLWPSPWDTMSQWISPSDSHNWGTPTQAIASSPATLLPCQTRPCKTLMHRHSSAMPDQTLYSTDTHLHVRPDTVQQSHSFAMPYQTLTAQPPPCHVRPDTVHHSHPSAMSDPVHHSHLSAMSDQTLYITATPLPCQTRHCTAQSPLCHVRSCTAQSPLCHVRPDTVQYSHPSAMSDPVQHSHPSAMSDQTLYSTVTPLPCQTRHCTAQPPLCHVRPDTVQHSHPSAMSDQTLYSTVTPLPCQTRHCTAQPPLCHVRHCTA